jgi:hypothetical protein
MSTNRTENEQRWAQHVKQAGTHKEGLAAYCRETGISRAAIHYWLRKLEKKSFVATTRTRPAFIPVQVLATAEVVRPQQLPDAKWVAEVLLYLSAGLCRRGR